ncbi:MAG TPA: PadR family transcriptional regulator [Anaerolineales bacterium]|nr:PadR family transcriptional regulator [Anaerolineales bacterium]HMV94768.1 PadR family transcriptional regulator [Anaerolineales bacterium]HMX18057.1 PadR family transcriptional regulator [Anaerolineales bacterium]HNA52786.1 PadR family transcriptional regulator [Anaerolineales bacterium]HNB85484.1 PadR family transcriptional regulator [Anaerolineales bacterium]
MTEISSHTRKFQKELNAGTSSLVLLSVLSRSKEPMYGYQIAKMLEESGPEIPMMKQGTLYPVLRSLEENGLLESTVEPSVSGPPRRYYKITNDGREALKEWAEIWKITKKFVDANLKG